MYGEVYEEPQTQYSKAKNSVSIQRTVEEEGEWLRHCEVGGSMGNIMESGSIGAEGRLKET